jgi:hypothetical protein
VIFKTFMPFWSEVISQPSDYDDGLLMVQQIVLSPDATLNFSALLVAGFALRKSHKKKQTAAYSGPAKSVRDKKVDQLRRRKTQALPWNAQSQIEALEELIRLGFVTVTASCPECTGCLGDFSCKPSGQVYVRCKEYACRKSFNGLNFASWLPHVPHCLTPLQVLQALKVWCHAGISKKISAYVPGLPSVILSFGRLCYTSSKTMTN